MLVPNFDYKRLYNFQIKRLYLEQTSHIESRKTLFYFFLKATIIEKELNKDLFEMTENELEKVLMVMDPRTERSSISNISRMYQYLRWCLNVGYCTDLLIDIDKNIRVYATKFVSKSKIVLYTREDLFNAFNNMQYFGDQAFLLCIFEGIRGKKFCEITNMKIEHLHEKNGLYYINLKGSEKLYRRANFQISPELYGLLIKFNNTKEYEDMREAISPLSNTPFIFRRSKVGRRQEDSRSMVNTSYFMNKTNFYKEFFQNKNFNLSDVEMSGAMYYLNNLLEEKGDRKVNNEILSLIARKFDKGLYTHSITKEETVSYSKVRELIDDDFFRENYGEFEYI